MCQIRVSQQDLHKSCIQGMSPNRGPCLECVDVLAEKHSIPYSYLKSMPQYRYLHGRKSDGPFDLIKVEKSDKIDGTDNSKCSKRSVQANKCIASEVNLNRFTDLSNFRPYSHEIIAMPFTIEPPTGNRPNNSNNRDSDEKKLGSERI